MKNEPNPELEARIAAYQARVEGRRDRLEARADKAERTALELQKRSNDLVEHIPLGQPILVGHHSEKRHRRTLEKSRNAMFRSVEESSKANDLRRRAEAVGSGGIQSDDPEAVPKLRARLQELEQAREQMKAVNRSWRKHGRPFPDAPSPAWERIQEETGIPSSRLAAVRRSMAAHSWESAPFPGYALTNMGGNIRRIRERIEHLSEIEEAPPLDFTGERWRIYQDAAAGRVCAERTDGARWGREVFKAIRGQGWVWSRQNERFQRKLGTRTAEGAAHRLAHFLEKTLADQ